MIYDIYICIISISHYCNVEHLETTLQIPMVFDRDFAC